MPQTDRLVLGIHTGHDRGASLLKNGELVFHIAEDRLDRKKHSESQDLPARAINKVFEYTGVPQSSIDAVGISCVNRQASNILDYYRSGLEEITSAKPSNFFLAPHHVCHALCCGLLHQTNEIFVYVYDGAGDLLDDGSMESETLFQITSKEEIVLHQRCQDYHETFSDKIEFNYSEFMYEQYRDKKISLGKKYNQFTSRCGFGELEDGKTMGLAPFGTPLVDVRQFEPLELDFDLTLENVLKEIADQRISQGVSCTEFDARHQADLAATAQAYLELAMDRISQIIAREFGIHELGLCGGVALNCVINHQIAKHGPFDRVIPFPAAGDDGQSVGAALYADRRLGPHCQSVVGFSPYLGPDYSTTEIIDALDEQGLAYCHLETNDLIEAIADRITAGRVVGLVRGRSELGPRALGHRSIFASATHAKMRDILNERVKFRELFRPYAPIVPATIAGRYFDIAGQSPYMLFACDVRPEYRDKLPGITHVDGTARVQTASADDDPFLVDLLMAVGERSGYPIAINTSFNLAGEPIVESPRDAIQTFLRTRIDTLVMENVMTERSSD